MAFLEERTISCPYCGESIEVLIEPVEEAQDEDAAQYIEDCQVCCRPIHFHETLQGGFHHYLSLPLT